MVLASSLIGDDRGGVRYLRSNGVIELTGTANGPNRMDHHFSIVRHGSSAYGT